MPTFPTDGKATHHPVKDRNDEQGEEGGEDQTTDDDRCQRALDFSPSCLGNRHGYEAQRSHQAGQEDGTQQVRTALSNDLMCTHCIGG